LRLAATAGLTNCGKRQPLKKLDTDEESLLKLMYRWRKEADQAGQPIRRSLSPMRSDAMAFG
jgi:hypothetical protein